MSKGFINYKVLYAIKNRQTLFSSESLKNIERFCCVKCLDILIEPFQSDCGCRYCHYCLLLDQEEYKTNYCLYCHECQGPVGKKFCQDKAVEKEILESEVHCKNKNCEKFFKFKDLVEHMENCEEKEEICIHCKELFSLKEIRRHKDVECEMIKIKCKDCGVEITQKYQKEKHNNMNDNDQEICDYWKEVCPYKCSPEVQDNVKIHFSTCKKRPRKCVMNEIGCSKMLNDAEMKEHLNNDKLEHYVVMMNILKVNKEENKDLLICLTQNTLRKEEEINNLIKMSITNSGEVKRLTEDVKGIEGRYDTLGKEVSYLREMYVNNEGLDQSYTWKIEDIACKIDNAKKGLNLQIYSEGFYTSKRGYKMFLKIYPNGDGSSLGKHISIYFLIAKGKFDDEIVWPFNKKISISLLHNKTAKSNKILNMRPDLNESCYGKPIKEYNVAAGQPNFINHVDLVCTREYVKNGAITVVTQVI